MDPRQFRQWSPPTMTGVKTSAGTIVSKAGELTRAIPGQQPVAADIGKKDPARYQPPAKVYSTPLSSGPDIHVEAAKHWIQGNHKEFKKLQGQGADPKQPHMAEAAKQLGMSKSQLDAVKAIRALDDLLEKARMGTVSVGGKAAGYTLPTESKSTKGPVIERVSGSSNISSLGKPSASASPTAATAVRGDKKAARIAKQSAASAISSQKADSPAPGFVGRKYRASEIAAGSSESKKSPISPIGADTPASASAGPQKKLEVGSGATPPTKPSTAPEQSSKPAPPEKQLGTGSPEKAASPVTSEVAGQEKGKKPSIEKETKDLNKEAARTEQAAGNYAQKKESPSSEFIGSGYATGAAVGRFVGAETGSSPTGGTALPQAATGLGGQAALGRGATVGKTSLQVAKTPTRAATVSARQSPGRIGNNPGRPSASEVAQSSMKSIPGTRTIVGLVTHVSSK